LKVVSVKRDVESTQGRFHLFTIRYHSDESLGQLHAAPLDANYHHVLGARINFQYLVGHTAQRSLDSLSIHKHGLLCLHVIRIMKLALSNGGPVGVGAVLLLSEKGTG
jgi:hypothetical protein